MDGETVVMVVYGVAGLVVTVMSWPFHRGRWGVGSTPISCFESVCHRLAGVEAWGSRLAALVDICCLASLNSQTMAVMSLRTADATLSRRN